MASKRGIQSLTLEPIASVTLDGAFYALHNLARDFNCVVLGKIDDIHITVGPSTTTKDFYKIYYEEKEFALYARDAARPSTSSAGEPEHIYVTGISVDAPPTVPSDATLLPPVNVGDIVECPECMGKGYTKAYGWQAIICISCEGTRTVTVQNHNGP